MTATAAMYRNVRMALRHAVAAVPGIPAPTYWAIENKTFTTPTDGKTPWLRETFAPQVNTRASLGVDAYLLRQTGSYLLDLFFPFDSDTAASDALAGAVLDALPAGTALAYGGQTVRIRATTVTKPLATDSWFQVPLMVSWLADTLTS